MRTFTVTLTEEEIDSINAAIAARYLQILGKRAPPIPKNMRASERAMWAADYNMLLNKLRALVK